MPFIGFVVFNQIVCCRRTSWGYGGPRGTVKECGGLFAILGDFGVLLRYLGVNSFVGVCV